MCNVIRMSLTPSRVVWPTACRLCSARRYLTISDGLWQAPGLTAAGTTGIIAVERALRQAVGPTKSQNSQSTAMRPSLGRVAVSAFYDDRHGKPSDMYRKPHRLTPSRVVWPTACRLCSAQRYLTISDGLWQAPGLTAAGTTGIIAVERALRQAVGPTKSQNSQSTAMRPSLGRVAVSAFYDDRHGKPSDMYRKPHRLTPSRVVWPTACRLCSACAILSCFDTGRKGAAEGSFYIMLHFY